MVEQSRGDDIYDFYDAEDFNERGGNVKPHFEYVDEALPLITYSSSTSSKS
jgi:hypothetical protein